MDYPQSRKLALTNITKLHQKMVNIGSKYGKVGKILCPAHDSPLPRLRHPKASSRLQFRSYFGPGDFAKSSFLNFLKQFNQMPKELKIFADLPGAGKFIYSARRRFLHALRE
jgi:hypothetical protein